MAIEKLLSERQGKEIKGLLFFLAAVLIFTSLVSYHPEDPAWFFSTGVQTTAKNAIGRLGAFISIVLYEALGAVSFIVPAALATLGWVYFWREGLKPFWIKFLSILIFISSLAGLSEIVFGEIKLFGKPLPAGGLLGAGVEKITLPILNSFGSVITLIALVLISLAVAMRFSYGEAAGTTAELSRSAFQKLKKFYLLLQGRKAKKRERTQRAETLSKYAQRSAVKAKSDDQEKDALPVEKPKDTLFESPAPPRRKGKYSLPPLTLLDAPQEEQETLRSEDIMECRKNLTTKFKEFGIDGEITEYHPGPVVTMYEFLPAPSIKYSKITSLVDDLCLALRAESILIDRIPGKPTIGIEVPNDVRETIFLRELLGDEIFQKSSARLPLTLGKQTHGETYVADLADMPHLLVAGATGTGKSVSVHAMLVSMLYKMTPDELKLILIDPKRVELGLYENLPHLFAPVIYSAKEAANVLRWLVHEMDERYKMLVGEIRARDIEQFNLYLKEYKDARDENGEAIKPIPYIVLVIDEFADLMMVSPREVEDAVARLAQMARAVGIHLIIATQRPSVDVITGVIKANFPSRISFRVSSKVDSRTILDANGSERLLGKGDMLFLPPGTARLKRIHGGLVTEKEIQRVVNFLKQQGAPEYNEILAHPAGLGVEGDGAPFTEMDDELYEDAVRLVVTTGTASASNLQRRFGIGYNRAARLIDMMEADSIVGPARGSKPRKLLVKSLDEVPFLKDSSDK